MRGWKGREFEKEEGGNGRLDEPCSTRRGRKHDWTGPPHLSSAIPDYVIPASGKALGSVSQLVIGKHGSCS